MDLLESSAPAGVAIGKNRWWFPDGRWQQSERVLLADMLPFSVFQ